MVAWSSAAFKNAVKLSCSNNLILSSKNVLNAKTINHVSVRNSGHGETMFVTPSRYMWRKFKDSANFYFLLGIIPIMSLVTYTNIFIGEAELVEIPEGYQPKHWEYYSHPITRFLAKILPSHQEIFETNCHHIYLKMERRQRKILKNKIMEKMAEREDYQSYYYHKPLVKYGRLQYENSKKTEFDDWGRSGGYVLEK